MSVNLAFYEEAALTTPYSEGKVPYQAGYYPVFHGETFNATDGEAKNKVVFLQEVHASKDFWYSTAQVAPVETGDHQRDPDEDDAEEWHVYVAHPVEHIITGEEVATGNSVLTEFELDFMWVKPGSETIYVAAAAKIRNTDFWICYKDGHIKFAVAPGVVAITADYTHGDDGAGAVEVPASNVIEANGDWSWTDVWEIPHGYDANRGTGHEKDGIPVIIRGKVDAGTTDAEGNAVTLYEQRIKVQGWEHNSKY